LIYINIAYSLISLRVFETIYNIFEKNIYIFLQTNRYIIYQTTKINLNFMKSLIKYIVLFYNPCILSVNFIYKQKLKNIIIIWEASKRSYSNLLN